MNNLYVRDWEAIRQRMEDWWHGCNTERPILSIEVNKKNLCGDAIRDGWAASSSGTVDINKMKKNEAEMSGAEAKRYWTDFDVLMQRNRLLFDQRYYTAETYPKFAPNIGVGSLALFLGCEPEFTKDTIWYKPALSDPETDKLILDTSNQWLQWSLQMMKKAKSAAGGEFLVGIPDLVENLDILGPLYDTQELMFHMMDYPEEIHRLQRQLLDIWFEVYKMHYDIIVDDKGYSNFGPFQLWGKGKIAKLQVDVSAMFSKDMFDEFALPYLDEQTKWLDKSMYHLDGVDALKHLDSILSLEHLDALEWTPGAGQPDGGDEVWDYIYEKTLDKGKQIYALVAPENIKKFVKKFGHKGVFIMTSAKDEAEAETMAASRFL